MLRLLTFLTVLIGFPFFADAQCASGYTQLSKLFACQSQTTSFNFGNTTVLGGGGGEASRIFANQFALGQSGTLRSISINLTGASTSMFLGVYDNTGAGGSPGALLASTASFSGVSGWNTSMSLPP